MSRTDVPPSRYHYARPGPVIADAFQVREGVVGIESADGLPVTLLPGALWPGLGALSPALAEALQPSGSVQTPGTVTIPITLTDRELQAALAFLGAARLSRGRLAVRLTALSEIILPRQVNHAVLGVLLSSTRESVTKALAVWAAPQVD